MRRERHAQLRSKRPPQLLGVRERKRARGRRKLMPVIVHRRFLEKDGLCRSSRFRAGRARREKGRLNFFKSGRTNPLKDGTEYSVQPEAWSRRSRSIQSPWEATALSIASVACAGARRGRGMSLQPSLFTPSHRGRGRIVGNERHTRRVKGEPGRAAPGPRRMAMAGRASAC